MVEDMEEGILSFLFSGKFMNIIEYENVNHLVKMKKVILVIVSYRLNKLSLKLIRINIQNCFVGMLLFYEYPYCLRKVSFTQT